jgi:hypothetical protein
MASRQVRKLLQAQTEAELSKHAQLASDEDEDQQTGASKPFNPFDLLSDEEVRVKLQGRTLMGPTSPSNTHFHLCRSLSGRCQAPRR